MRNVYGNTIKVGLSEAIIVSSKEAERLRLRADRLDLACVCPRCNPLMGDCKYDKLS